MQFDDSSTVLSYYQRMALNPQLVKIHTRDIAETIFDTYDLRKSVDSEYGITKQSIDIDRSGKFLISGSNNGKLLLHEIGRGYATQTACINVSSTRVSCLQFNHFWSYVAACVSSRCGVQVVDLEHCAILDTAKQTETYAAVSLHWQTTKGVNALITYSNTTDYIHIYDPRRGQPLQFSAHTDIELHRITAVRWLTSEQNYILAGTLSGNILMYDLRRLQEPVYSKTIATSAITQLRVVNSGTDILALTTDRELYRIKPDKFAVHALKEINFGTVLMSDTLQTPFAISDDGNSTKAFVSHAKTVACVSFPDNAPIQMRCLLDVKYGVVSDMAYHDAGKQLVIAYKNAPLEFLSFVPPSLAPDCSIYHQDNWSDDD